MNAKDLYKYFRIEARELSDALNRDALELEKSDAPGEVIARLLRHAHTLKGAARVMKLADIADLAHAMEEALGPFREGGAPVPRAGSDRLLSLLDDLGRRLTLLDSPAGEGGAPKKEAPPGMPLPAAARRWDIVRFEVTDVDAVLETMSEVTSQLSHLRQEMSGLGRIKLLASGLAERSGSGSAETLLAMEEIQAWLDRFHRASGEALDQAERDLRQAHERAERLRLVPAASLFDFLERAVRDAARGLGKEVGFESAGGGSRLDAPVLASLQDAFLHLVRNAVAHGIEKPQARQEAGKPAQGRIRVAVERRGDRVSFVCQDDGQGIDPAEVRRQAVAKGLLPPKAPDPLPLADAVRLLLQGGLSTAGTVTELSGRGIGLDAVRATVEGLRGEIRVESQVGSGTRIEIRVPYSLSAFPALAVEAEGMRMLIPLSSVRKAMRISEGDLARSPEGDTIQFEDLAIPVLPLESALSRAPAKTARVRPGVILEAAQGLALVGVDRILGVRETVAGPLPQLIPSEDILAGASLDVEGNPCLVLDPEGLVRAARSRRGDGPAVAVAAPPPVLIVDDSLTTRMLEQSILESAGYAVDCAVSGEDALAKVREKRYGLVLVDVEMPGMDGFTLLARLRDDPATRGIPSIMVTSRSFREDRRRAEQVGASDYIIKGEFDQARLLGRIKEILG